jgi:hypothetical protein
MVAKGKRWPLVATWIVLIAAFAGPLIYKWSTEGIGLEVALAGSVLLLIMTYLILGLVGSLTLSFGGVRAALDRIFPLSVRRGLTDPSRPKWADDPASADQP